MMELILALVVAAAALIGFDLAAIRWGVDSRPRLADDHRR